MIDITVQCMGLNALADVLDGSGVVPPKVKINVGNEELLFDGPGLTIAVPGCNSLAIVAQLIPYGKDSPHRIIFGWLVGAGVVSMRRLFC